MRNVVISIIGALVLLPSNASVTAQPQGSAVIPRGRGTLEVVVVDEQGTPLAGVLVSLPGRRSSTGRDGSCKFNLLPGRYPIRVSKGAYRGRRMNAGVRPGETTTTRVQLQKLPGLPPPQK